MLKVLIQQSTWLISTFRSHLLLVSIFCALIHIYIQIRIIHVVVGCLFVMIVAIVCVIDPFAEAKDSGAPGAKEYVHIRIQQRNGKKSLTTVQGLKKEFSYEKILKDVKKEFCCNGNVVQDKELGKVIQLQGDQRKNVSTFLVQAGIVKKDQIKIHGF